MLSGLLKNKKCSWPEKLLRLVFFFFWVMLCCSFFACNHNGGFNKEKSLHLSKFRVIISDDSDDFIDLKHLDYDSKGKAVYGLYFGMQRNMARHYYKLSLTSPYEISILGMMGQGPDKLKNPPLSIRFLDDLVMVGSGKTIKLFDRNENFVNIIDGLPVYPADFYFKDGILSLLTVRYVHQAKDEDDVFLKYDIGNKRILKSIKFGDIKRAFEKNGIDFSKLEAYTSFEGKVINEDVAVISIPFTNLFNRNAYAILNLKSGKINFFKAENCYKQSTYSVPFRSSVNKDCFFIIENRVIPPETTKNLREKEREKMLLKLIKEPLSFCVHRVNISGKEEKNYCFNVDVKDILVARCHGLIEIEPGKFVLSVRFTRRDDYTDAIILWDARETKL